CSSVEAMITPGANSGDKSAAVEVPPGDGGGGRQAVVHVDWHGTQSPGTKDAIGSTRKLSGRSGRTRSSPDGTPLPPLPLHLKMAPGEGRGFFGIAPAAGSEAAPPRRRCRMLLSGTPGVAARRARPGSASRNDGPRPTYVPHTSCGTNQAARGRR